jgi:biotin operon repressor
VLTKEKLDEIGARLEHTSQKSLRCLAQQTGISKSSVAKAMKLLKLQLYKVTVVHALQLHDPAGGINLCNWFL